MASESWSSVHQDDRPAEPRVEEHLARSAAGCRAFGISTCERVVPADDVDPLAAELVDDVLDPAAADADAGPDAVDLQVDAEMTATFDAVAGLAGDGPDLDGAVLDLGDLLLEEAADEVGVARG